MPMNRKLYPKNWEALAHSIKDSVGYRCEECGRPCRRPGESFDALVQRLDEGSFWEAEAFDEVDGADGVTYEARPGRFTLTVAHLDHQPENCDRANLRAWCAPCHCRYDLKAMATKRRLKAERDGQMSLFDQ